MQLGWIDFSKEDRQFYDLDRIWRDGKVVDVHSL